MSVKVKTHAIILILILKIISFLNLFKFCFKKFKLLDMKINCAVINSFFAYYRWLRTFNFFYMNVEVDFKWISFYFLEFIAIRWQMYYIKYFVIVCRKNLIKAKAFYFLGKDIWNLYFMSLPLKFILLISRKDFFLIFFLVLFNLIFPFF